jgi:hypothetical protein
LPGRPPDEYLPWLTSSTLRQTSLACDRAPVSVTNARLVAALIAVSGALGQMV